MARIIIVSQWLLGHLVPALGLGAELQRRGHSVCVLSAASFRPLIEEAGLEFREIRHGKYPQKFVTETLLEMQAVLEAVEFDLMICDSGLCAPAYIAEKRGVPWASYMTAAFWPDRVMPGVPHVNARMRTMFEKAANEARACIGLPPLADFARTRGDLAGLSPDAHLMMILAELNPFPNEVPPSSVFIGPCSYGPDRGPGTRPVTARGHDGPCIVVCTTSADRSGYRETTEAYVEAALRAFSGQPGRLLVSVHTPYAGETPLADNVEWVTTVPNHDLLFPQADLIITHGGCGTLQKAIRYGVPLVIVPLGPDHAWAAARCTELGIAETIEPERMSAETLEKTVCRLLAGGREKENIRRLSPKVDGRASNWLGADTIESLLVNKSLR